MERTTASVSYETFPALDVIHSCRHAFLNRVPGLDVKTDRESALGRLRDLHDTARRHLGFDAKQFVTSEQVHGSTVAVVREPSPVFAGADGLITGRDDVCLGVYVADCAAVYLVDPVHSAIGLVHSGKKGSELGIVSNAIRSMERDTGSQPAELVVQIGPCIRPPDYEVNFAGQIAEQCRQAGVVQIHDSGRNTASDLERYYSYRVERGKTGRMLALLSLR